MAEETLVADPTQKTTGPQLTDDQSAELNGWIAEMYAEQRSDEEVQRVVRGYLDKYGTSIDEPEVAGEEEVAVEQGPREGPIGSVLTPTGPVQPEPKLDEEGNVIKPVTSDFDYFNDKDYEHLRAAAANFTTISTGRDVDRSVSGYGTRGAEVDRIITETHENPDISDFVDHDEVKENGLINPKTGKQYTLPELGEIKEFMDANDIDGQKVRDESAIRNADFTQGLPVVAWNEEEERFATRVKEDGDQWSNTDEENARFNRFNNAGEYSAKDLEDVTEHGVPKVLAADSQNLFNELIYNDPVISTEIEPAVRRDLQPQLLDEQQKLLKKYGITTQSQLKNASPELLQEMNTEYAQLERNLINKGVNENEEFIKRRRVYTDIEKEYLDSQLNKIGIKASGIPKFLRVLGEGGNDLWGSIVGIKGSVEGLGATASGLTIADNSRIIRRLEELDPSDPLPPDYYQGIKAPAENVGERIEQLEESNKKYRKLHVDKLTSKANLDEFQKFFYQPAFLDGEITIRDVTSSSLKQVPNLAVSILPVIGPLLLEGGSIYADTIKAGASAYYNLPDGKDPTSEQATAYLETPEGNKALHIAVAAIGTSSALESVGNVFQLKAIFGSKAGKKVMGNLIKGNFKKSLKSVKTWGKDQLVGVLGEVATEVPQTAVQQASNVLASGDSKYWDVHELKETAAQTLVSTFVLQGGGSVTVNAIKSSMSGTTPSKRDGLVTSFNRKIDNDFKTGKITKEQADEHKQYSEDYADALSLVPEGIKRENRDAAADLMVEKLELEREVEGKDPGMVKTKKDKLKLIDAQLDAIVNDAPIPTSLEKNSEGNIPTKPSIGDQTKAKQDKIQRESILNNLPAEESQEIKDLENRKANSTDEGEIETINRQIDDIKNDAVQDGKDDTERFKKKVPKVDKGIDEALPDRTIDKLDSWIKAIEDDKKRFGGIAPIGIDPKAFHTAGVLALKATKAAIKAGRSIKAGLEAGYASVKDMMSFDQYKSIVADELGFYNTTAEQNAVINQGLDTFNQSSGTTAKAIKESYQTVKGVFSHKQWNNYVHQKVFGVFPNTRFGKETSPAPPGTVASDNDLQTADQLSYQSGKGNLDIKLEPNAKDKARRKKLKQDLRGINEKAGARQGKDPSKVEIREFRNLDDGSVITRLVDKKTGKPLRDFQMVGYTKAELKKTKDILAKLDALHPSAFRSKAITRTKKRLKVLFNDKTKFDETQSVNEITTALMKDRPKLGTHPGKPQYKNQAEYEAGEGKIKKYKLLSTPKKEIKSLEDITISDLKPRAAGLSKNIANNEIVEQFKDFILLYNDLISMRQAFHYSDLKPQNYPSESSLKPLEKLALLNHKILQANIDMNNAKYVLERDISDPHYDQASYQGDFDKAKAQKAALEKEVVEATHEALKALGDPTTKEFNRKSKSLFGDIIPKLIRNEDGTLKPRRGGDTDIPGVISGLDFRVKDANGDLVLVTEADAQKIFEADTEREAAKAEDSKQKYQIELKNYQKLVGKPLLDGVSFFDWIERSIHFGKLAKGGISKKNFPAFFIEAIDGPAAQDARVSLKKYRETRQKLERHGLPTNSVPENYSVPKDLGELAEVNNKLTRAGLPALPNNAQLKFQLDEDVRAGISGNKIRQVVVENIPTQDVLASEFDIRSTISRERIRDFQLAPGHAVGSGEGGAGYRLSKGNKELTPGAVQLVNSKTVNALSDSMPAQVYDALLTQRMVRRDVAMQQGLDDAKGQTNRTEREADAVVAKAEQRKLIKKINDVGTAKVTKQKHLQDLLDYQTAYPTILSKTLVSNGNSATDLAAKHDITLSPPSRESHDSNAQGYTSLLLELEQKYAEGGTQIVVNKDNKKQADLTLDDAIHELDIAFGRVENKSAFESALWSNTEALSVQIARRAKGFKLPGWNEQIFANSMRMNGDIKGADAMDKKAHQMAASGISGKFSEGETSWTALEQGELNITLAEAELTVRPSVKSAFKEVTGRDWNVSQEEGSLQGLVKHNLTALKNKHDENAMIANLEKMKEDEPTNTCL